MDPRFASFGKLPPKSKADYAFLLHGFYHLKDSGTMAIVLPHGVLFRGSSEEAIRKKLLEEGKIYAVIGLPAGIFYSTSIPTCILVLKKNHTSQGCSFHRCSKEFKKEGPRNFFLTSLDKIFNAYKERKSIKKFSYLASLEEIQSQGFNLNIPRYVDTSEEEEEIDLEGVFTELLSIETDEKQLKSELNGFFKQLGLKNEI